MKCIFLAIKLRKFNSLRLFITVHPVQKKPSAIVRQLPTIFISRHFTPTGEGSPLLTSLSAGLRKIFDEKKRLNRSKCCLECGLVWPRKPRIRWRSDRISTKSNDFWRTCWQSKYSTYSTLFASGISDAVSRCQHCSRLLDLATPCQSVCCCTHVTTLSAVHTHMNAALRAVARGCTVKSTKSRSHIRCAARCCARFSCFC